MSIRGERMIRSGWLEETILVIEESPNIRRILPIQQVRLYNFGDTLSEPYYTYLRDHRFALGRGQLPVKSSVIRLLISLRRST